MRQEFAPITTRTITALSFSIPKDTTSKRSVTLRGKVVVLSRRQQMRPWRVVLWDGATLRSWAKEIDGCDAVINLESRISERRDGKCFFLLLEGCTTPQ